MRHDSVLHRIHRQRSMALGLLCAVLASGCGPDAAPPASSLPAATPAVSADTNAPAARGWRLPSAHGEVQVEIAAEGLSHPWGMAFLPDGSLLVTERAGQLRRMAADGSLSPPLTGVPAVFASGQGGLLDVALSPQFAEDGLIYLSYAEPGEGGSSGTTVARARLTDNGLEDLNIVFRQEPKIESQHHFGSRLVFDRAGHLFITTGDRGERIAAQDLATHQGKLIRLMPDGSVPADNPLVGRSDARAEIWSWGHRNMQGAALNPWSGMLWTSEHGPRGGDEVNIPQPGRNYGWPIITHGINYSGLKIPEAEGEAKEGMEAPHHVWEVSPALSGMAFYDHARHPAWQHSLFLGAMAQRALIRLSLEGDQVRGEERLLESLGWRIRDVEIGADGAVYVLTDETEGKLLRLNLTGS